MDRLYCVFIFCGVQLSPLSSLEQRFSKIDVDVGLHHFYFRGRDYFLSFGRNSRLPDIA